MTDKYTAGIEVANACRQFYVSRLQTAETLKERLAEAAAAASASEHPANSHKPTSRPGSGSVTRQNSVDAFGALVTHLRSELASLIDLDLQVMRQLLMLNEHVEELKWQRQRQALLGATATAAIYESSCESFWSRETMDELPSSSPWPGCRTADATFAFDRRPPFSDFDYGTLTPLQCKYPTPSALSLLVNASSQDQLSSNGSFDRLDRATTAAAAVDADPSTSRRREVAAAGVGVGGCGDIFDVRCRAVAGVDVRDVRAMAAAVSPPGEYDRIKAGGGGEYAARRSSSGRERLPVPPPTKPKTARKPKSPTSPKNVEPFAGGAPLADSAAAAPPPPPTKPREMRVRIAEPNNNLARRRSSDSGNRSPVSPTVSDGSDGGRVTKSERQLAGKLKLNEAHCPASPDAFQELSPYVEMHI